MTHEETIATLRARVAVLEAFEARMRGVQTRIAEVLDAESKRIYTSDVDGFDGEGDKLTPSETVEAIAYQFRRGEYNNTIFGGYQMTTEETIDALRARVDHLEGEQEDTDLWRLFWKSEKARLQARGAELEALELRMKGAPIRIASAFRRWGKTAGGPYAEGYNNAIAHAAQSFEDGDFNDAIFGETTK